MSTFTPDAGTLFYARSKLTFTERDATGGAVVATRQRDRSYHSNVFRCKAADHYSVVADIVAGNDYGKKPCILLRHEFEFFSVGPEVIAALGLEA